MNLAVDAFGNVYVAGTDSDNVFKIQFREEPIPTVSEWGVVVMVLVLLVAGTIVFAGVRRGRSAAA